MPSIYTAYAADIDLTITLAALPTDANLLTGRESTAVNNTSTKYLDYLLGGKITTGTSPTTAKSIRVYVYANFDDTPTYPDVFDGTDSAETITSADIRNSCIALAASMATDATSDRTYYFNGISIASLFGGRMPRYWGVFVTHDTAVNLNATAGNHQITATPIYETIA